MVLCLAHSSRTTLSNYRGRCFPDLPHTLTSTLVFRAGSLPSELCGLKALEIMDISNNQLTGKCGADFGSIKQPHPRSSVALVVCRHFSEQSVMSWMFLCNPQEYFDINIYICFVHRVALCRK